MFSPQSHGYRCISPLNSCLNLSSPLSARILTFPPPSPRVVLWHCSQCVSPGFCVVFLSISYVAACSSMALVCIHVLPHTHPLPWPVLRCASSTEGVGSDFKSFLPSGHWHSVSRQNAGHSPSPAHAPCIVGTF